MVKDLPFSELQPGQRLQQTIYDDNGRILLRSGTVLTFRHLQLMKDWRLDYVSVDVEIPEEEREQPEPDVHLVGQGVQNEMMQAIQEVFTSVTEDKALALDRMVSCAPILVEEVTSHDHVTLDLAGLRRVDNYTFMHSLAVAVLAIAAGAEIGLKRELLLDLALSALLHDIGKVNIPPQILHKPGPLTPDEWVVMRRHPRLGAELLTERSGLSTPIMRGVYEHHERNDGSGYPHRLRGEQICLMGKIIAVADFYDSITSDRIYRGGTEPHLAVEQLIAESLSTYDGNTVGSFIRSLAVYPVGRIVVMDNGEIGRVLSYDHNVPHRPKVLILQDSDGQWLPKPRECDLMHELNRFVHEVKKG